LRALAGNDWILAVSFSPDGNFLATGGRAPLKVWETASGREVHDLSGRSTPIDSLAFSADGRWLAAATRENVTLVNTATGRVTQTLAIDGFSQSRIGLSATSPPLLITLNYNDRTGRVWDVATGRQIAVLKGHTEQISDVALAADGRVAATASYDRTVKLWDVASGRELRTLTEHDKVLTVAFSPDGALVASGSSDHAVRVWEVATGKKCARRWVRCAPVT
jgi:WD40 repeat protein